MDPVPLVSLCCFLCTLSMCVFFSYYVVSTMETQTLKQANPEQSTPQPTSQPTPQPTPQPTSQPVPQPAPQPTPQPTPQPSSQSTPQSAPQPMPQLQTTQPGQVSNSDKELSTKLTKEFINNFGNQFVQLHNMKGTCVDAWGGDHGTITKTWECTKHNTPSNQIYKVSPESNGDSYFTLRPFTNLNNCMDFYTMTNNGQIVSASCLNDSKDPSSVYPARKLVIKNNRGGNQFIFGSPNADLCMNAPNTSANDQIYFTQKCGSDYEGQFHAIDTHTI